MHFSGRATSNKTLAGNPSNVCDCEMEHSDCTSNSHTKNLDINGTLRNVENTWNPPVENAAQLAVPAYGYPRAINYEVGDFVMPPSLSSEHANRHPTCIQHALLTGVPRDEEIGSNGNTNGSYSPQPFANEIPRPLPSNSNPNPTDLQVYDEGNNTASGSSVANGGRRKRKPYNRHQIDVLEAIFQKENYIRCEKRKEVATALNLSERQVKVWFQNRRMKAKRQSERGVTNNTNGSETDADLSQDGRSRSPILTNPPPLRIGTSPPGINHAAPSPTLPPPSYPAFPNSPFQVLPVQDYAPSNMYCPPMPSELLSQHFLYNTQTTAHLSLNCSPGFYNAVGGSSSDSERSHNGIPSSNSNGLGRVPDGISRQLTNNNYKEDPSQCCYFNQMSSSPTLPQQNSYLNSPPTVGNGEHSDGNGTPTVPHAPATTYSCMWDNANEGNPSFPMMNPNYNQAQTYSYPPPAPGYFYEANQPTNVHPNANMQFTSFQPTSYFQPPSAVVNVPSYLPDDPLSSQLPFPSHSHPDNLYPDQM